MKNYLISWNIPRVIRFVFGIAAIVHGATSQAYVLIFAGMMLAIMALLNIGCCSVSGCAVPANKKSVDKSKEVFYEEVVQEK